MTLEPRLRELLQMLDYLVPRQQNRDHHEEAARHPYYSRNRPFPNRQDEREGEADAEDDQRTHHA